MHLLASLNAGFTAAANGTAGIFVRGSSTRATWYASFEGDGANSSGSDITLDAYGSALVYVNQLVDVVVKDSSGNAVRTYGDGVAAPNTEVQSLAFTGVDYETAASAAGNPTTLQAVLDLWLTNSGAVDWKVLIGGVATTLQAAFGITTGMWFNVKDPTYGAVGDGTTSDQAAVAAALAAAVAAGGGVVFFPKGTYRLTAGLSWDARVHLLGLGAELSVITMDAAAELVLTFGSDSTLVQPCIISGVKFQTAQANSATTIRLDQGNRVLISDCMFGGTTTATGVFLQINTTDVCYVDCVRCYFRVQSASNAAITQDAAATSYVTLDWCVFELPVGFTGPAVDFDTTAEAARFKVRNCFFDADTNATAGTFNAIDFEDGYVTLLNNEVTSGFAEAFDFNPSGSCFAWATGNHVRNSSGIEHQKLYDIGATPLKEGSYLEMKPTRRVALAAGVVTVADGVEGEEIRSTSTVPTITMPSIFFPGQRLNLHVINNSGAPWGSNITFTGGQLYGTTDTSAIDGEFVVAEFVASDIASAGTYTWVGVNVHLGSA